MLFSAPLSELLGVCFFAMARGDRQILIARGWTKARGAALGLALEVEPRPLDPALANGLEAALARAFPELPSPPRGGGGSADDTAREASVAAFSAPVDAPPGAPPGRYFGPAPKRSWLERLLPVPALFEIALDLPLDPRGLWFPTEHRGLGPSAFSGSEALHLALPVGVAAPPAFAPGLGHGRGGPLLPADHALYRAHSAGPRSNEDTWISASARDRA